MLENIQKGSRDPNYLAFPSRPRSMMAHLPASPQSDNSTASNVPSLAEVRQKSEEVFRVRACLWQYLVTAAVWAGKNVIINVGTGMGKTLAFLLPILLWNEGILVIVTPLNVLGKQNEAQLTAAGIPAISISAETATSTNFAVRGSSRKSLSLLTSIQLILNFRQSKKAAFASLLSALNRP